jgi:hypothetical protein
LRERLEKKGDRGSLDGELASVDKAASGGSWDYIN